MFQSFRLMYVLAEFHSFNITPSLYGDPTGTDRISACVPTTTFLVFCFFLYLLFIYFSLFHIATPLAIYIHSWITSGSPEIYVLL